MTAIEVQHGRDLLRRDSAYEDGMTALLYVDMQRIWLEPGLDPSHPERGPDHYFYKTTASVTIPSNERLLAAARANGVEVIHTIIQSLTEDGRDCSLDHKLTPIHIAPSRPEGLPPKTLGPVGDEEAGDHRWLLSWRWAWRCGCAGAGVSWLAALAPRPPVPGVSPTPAPRPSGPAARSSL